MKKIAITLLALLIIVTFTIINGYNSIQKNDETVSAASSELLNQYQRRYDLVPNLINTVKGYSAYESDVLQNVVKARSAISQIKVDAQILNDPITAEKYQKAQDELSASLSRLLAISEQYPDLKASALYQDLMVQLEGSENRISVARGRYIEAIGQYNTQLRQFPGFLIANFMGYKPISHFTLDNKEEIIKTPVVEF
ncbi:LemA family protein [Thorsellia anophelis]|uniref:LemA protein n=1 Tax=Thorsellia anophelis DSM 18579 TaxID=1123402 RepID=A0A1I0A096_9GAMM|nr:LemA family protein [Thorsellia anophelis]SES87459.1 LemA protein [Thorsellia anophelis DSM 18579]